MSKLTTCECAIQYLMALNSRLETEIDNFQLNTYVGDFKVDSCTSYVIDKIRHVQDQIRESIRRIDDYEGDGDNTN